MFEKNGGHSYLNSCADNTEVMSQFKDKSKEDIVLQINELRKAIKRKHRNLKQDILSTEESWEKKLKPISEPLKKLLRTSDKPTVKNEPKEELQDPKTPKFEGSFYASNSAPPQGKRRKQLNKTSSQSDLFSENERMSFGSDEEGGENPINANPPADDELETREDIQASPHEVYESTGLTGEQFLKSPVGRDMAKDYINSQFKGKIAKDYFLRLINKGKAIDSTYGVRVEGDRWMIGNQPIDVDGDDMIIGDKRYQGTRGLYELIFMNAPNEYIYDEQDLENYKQILTDTNVHRLGYSRMGKLRSSRGHKYKNIISQLVARSDLEYTGQGLNTLEKDNHMRNYSDFINEDPRFSSSGGGGGVAGSASKPDVVYWNDPNELVERLRKLGASQSAGNNGHDKEINALIEELLEYEQQM